MNQIQRGNAKARRKQARLAHRKKSLTTTATTNEQVGHKEEDEEEEGGEEVNPTATGFEHHDDDENDEEEENEPARRDEGITVHTNPVLSSSGENTKAAPKSKYSMDSATREESNQPLKPQASVAPVKQTPYFSKYDSSWRYNDYSPSYNYSNPNPLPPRLQQQRQLREAAAQRRFQGRRGQYYSPIFYNSSRYTRDYGPSEREFDEPSNERYNSQQDSGVPNDDSSESGNLSGKLDLWRPSYSSISRRSVHAGQDLGQSESVDFR